MAARALMLIAFIAVPAAVLAADQQGNAVLAANANPIRKVVTMLQNMEKKIAAEEKKEKELYDKFMCYCKSSGGGLSSAIADTETRLPQIASTIKESEAKKVQLDSDLKSHQVDRSAAKEAMAKATALREKEASEFAATKNQLSTNLDALGKATAAITSGMSGSFLQTATAQILKQMVISKGDMLEADRQDIMSFLSSGEEGGYVPASGQITGILKTMHDEMAKSLSDAEAAEKASVASFGELMAAKEREVAANTHAIEVKTVRVGELAVEIVQMKNDLSDSEEQLIEDKKFAADLEKSCAGQTKEWEARQKTRGEEKVALAETIKILNDDDALELFKKTLPGSASFVQMAGTKDASRLRAASILREARRPNFDFIVMAIQGKKIGFEKVIKMIDGMVATMKQEQMDDDHKKEYCNKQFDFAEDKKKGLEQAVSDLEVAIEDAKEGISTLASEIEALEDGIKKLDKSVSEATEQRKEEHEEYSELMASNGAAKELLEFAKNRLNKFYNPKLYKKPPAPEAEDAVLAQLAAKAHREEPPAKLSAYKKKGEESGGVIAMVDLLIRDLDKEMTEAKVEEKDAQGDYEGMLGDSAEKRARDTKALTDKTAAKAGLETDLQSDSDSKTATTKELMGTAQYISNLHGECDWLLQYFDARKTARDSEVESLATAKAVLSGADFSLIEQTTQKKRKHLRA